MESFEKEVIDKLERIRKNTSKLVWWLIAVPLIIFLAFLWMALEGATAF